MKKFLGKYAVILACLVFANKATAQSQTTNEMDSLDTPTIESPDRSLTGFEATDEAQPLWELGVGGGLVDVPNYPASSERNQVGLALPYVIYRGDVFRFGGGGGARAVVVEERDLEIDISFGGAFSADSEDNSAREGMPELDFLFEVGPQLVYRVKDYSFDNGGVGRLNFRLQARAVFSTDFGSLEEQGFVLQPVLAYQQRGVLFNNAGFSASISPVFASEALHDFFYQVDEAFVTQQRNAFDAEGGYLGTELGVNFSFRLRDNMRLFLGFSGRLHSGAANEDSPLFEKDVTYSAALGFVWRLYESKTKASW